MTLTIAALPPDARHRLIPLLDAYAAEMAPTLAGRHAASGEAAAALLAGDARTEVLFASIGGAPAGFAIFFDQPEAVFARRCGALDDLFVAPAHRGRGVARRIVAELCAIGRARDWSHLRWFVPEADRGAIALYETIAERADWRSYVIRLDPEASL